MKFYGWGYDPIRFVYFKESHHRVSLAVQCLRICLLVLGCSSIPDQRTKILHVSGQLSPHATTNTQHSQKKKKKMTPECSLFLVLAHSVCVYCSLSCEDTMRRQASASQEQSLIRTQPCWNPDLRLLDSRNVRK